MASMQKSGYSAASILLSSQAAFPATCNSNAAASSQKVCIHVPEHNSLFTVKAKSSIKLLWAFQTREAVVPQGQTMT